MNDTDIPSSMEHGGRLAELHHKPECGKCMHTEGAHSTAWNPNPCSVVDCDCDGYESMQGDDDVQRSTGLPNSGDGAAGAGAAADSGGDEPAALGEYDPVIGFNRRAYNGGTCPYCGAYRMTGGFCPEDGFALTRLSCPECDEEHAASQTYCGQCGRKL